VKPLDIQNFSHFDFWDYTSQQFYAVHLACHSQKARLKKECVERVSSLIIISPAFQWLSHSPHWRTIEILVPLINQRDRAAILYLPTSRFIKTSLPEPSRCFPLSDKQLDKSPRRGVFSFRFCEFLSYVNDRLTQIPVTVKGVRKALARETRWRTLVAR